MSARQSATRRPTRRPAAPWRLTPLGRDLVTAAVALAGFYAWTLVLAMVAR